ncbi:hypothetical protein GW915_07295 [bacterium]|nr:hypothetical protein [bacterium]
MKKTFLTLIACATAGALACDEYGFTGFAPENDMIIPMFASNANVTEKEFNDTIDKFERVFTSHVAELGGQLNIVRRWSDGTVNAYADRNGGTYNVTMFGGLARHELMSKDGFASVICHELGHHIGGAPKINSFFGNSWASNEGQSDYFATAKCMRRFLQDEDNVAFVAELDVPEEVKLACFGSFESIEEQALCQRTSMAGLDLARVLYSLNETGTYPEFHTPDPAVVSKTNDRHPQGQCRLDTYYQGSLCDISYEDLPDQRDSEVSYCTRAKGDEVGVRPVCWFKP